MKKKKRAKRLKFVFFGQQSGDALYICDSSLTSNIPQSPDSLFTNMRMRGCDQTNESWNGSSFHHSCSLIGCPRRNVSQGPGRFKLNRWRLRHSQKAYKLGDQACTDDSINRWMPFPRQQLPKLYKVKIWLKRSQRDTIRERRKKRKKKRTPHHFFQLAHLAAWVACTWVSRLLLLTPLTISSTVQCWACHEKHMRL